MTDYEFLFIVKLGPSQYLFDPERQRAVYAGGHAEEAPMTLEVAYAMALLADQGLGGWLDDYFLGCERIDVDDLGQARALGPESLVPLDRAHVEPIFLYHIERDGMDDRERLPGLVR